jgi:VRR-NUC domain
MTSVRFQEAPANLESITNEADFQTLVVSALRYLGWTVIHISRMFGNTRGIPDLLCFRKNEGRLIELKIKGNTLSKGQRAWQELWLSQDTEVLLIHNTREDWELLMSKTA